MARRILQSDFTDKLDAILRGIDARQVTAADKVLALDSALSRYSQDKPRIRTVDFAGDSSAYYILHGQIVNVADTTRDAAVDVTSSGADQQLAIKFTLSRRMQVHAVRVLLRRTGSPAGTITCQIRGDSTSLPGSSALQTSNSLTSLTALPLGFEAGKVEFQFADPRPLAAGTYYVVLVPSSYSYTNGATEIVLGVDQSSVANTLFTYNGTVWTAYGTASAGVIEVIASLPDWSYRDSNIKDADIPAPTISADEVPQLLEDEDFEIILVDDTEYLYLPNHRPASTDTIRLYYPGRYVFNGSPAAVDIPLGHFEAACSLGAHYVCVWLAAKYAQNIDSGLSADIADRRNQSDVYASRAANFLREYEALLGIGEEATVTAAMKFGDLDRGTYSPRDFIYHEKRRR
ncbi:MAG TPA: hypothetical protein VII92_11360 [Anaerolineae bacterium]